MNLGLLKYIKKPIFISEKGIKVPISLQSEASLAEWLATKQLDEDAREFVEDTVRKQMHKAIPHKKETREDRAICISFKK